MPKPIWQQKIVAKLDVLKLHFVGDTHHIKCDACFAEGEKRGRKVTLRQAVNYSMHTCEACGRSAK